MAWTRIVQILSVALLSLALLGGSASAECAWVLWRDYSQWQSKTMTRVRHTWEVMSGHPTAALCDPARARALKETAEFFAGANRPADVATSFTSSEPDSVHVLLKSGAHYYTYSFLCLPDTVDPRGPKAK